MRSIINIWLLYFRPIAAKAAKGEVCNYIFINTQGEPCQKIGLYLTDFFSAKASLHITTTTLR